MAAARTLPFVLRPSPVAGTGAFATRRIRKGERIVEYLGERISHTEADRRFQQDDGGGSPHVLLFVVDGRTVIDAAVGGNEARFINHSCEPNCEAVIERRRIFIDAIRDIAPGEELTYDYELTRESEDDEEEEKRYPCRCGSPSCRGTLLGPREAPKKKRPGSARKKSAARGGSSTRAVSHSGRTRSGVRRGTRATKAPGRSRTAASRRKGGPRRTRREAATRT